jgi:hypothetical protein
MLNTSGGDSTPAANAARRPPSTSSRAHTNLSAPAAAARNFGLRRTSRRTLDAFRDHPAIVGNCHVENADPFTAAEIGGDHFRSSAVFLTQSPSEADAGRGWEAGGSLVQKRVTFFVAGRAVGALEGAAPEGAGRRWPT